MHYAICVLWTIAYDRLREKGTSYTEIDRTSWTVGGPLFSMAYKMKKSEMNPHAWIQ